MNVICIKTSPDKGYSRGHKINQIPPELRVYFGETYIVSEQVSGYQGAQKYILKERPRNYRYGVEYFSPLSEVDETEMVREPKEVEHA